MDHFSHRILLLSALAAAGACSGLSTPDSSEPVAELRTETGQGDFVAAPAAAPSAEWDEARSELLRNFAFRALDRELLEEGRHYLAQACEADAGDFASHAALARLYLSEGDVAAALVYAQRAEAAAPENPQVCLVYAAALAENKQTDRATEALEHAWKSVETDAEFARAVLLHYQAEGEVERAEDFVAWCITEDPERAGTWAAAGDLLLAQGDLESAAASFARAIELDPTTPTPESIDDLIGRGNRNDDAMLVAARAAEEKGNWEEAENLYRFLVGKESVRSEPRLGLARCINELGRWQEAELQLAHVPYGVRGWRGHLLQARIDIQAGRWAQARSAILLAQNERPGMRAAELLLEFVEKQAGTGG